MSGATLPIAERHARAIRCLGMVADGYTLTEIAAKEGLSRVHVNRVLLADVPEEYKKAQDLGIVERLQEQLEAFENASDHVTISRTRELMRSWQWIAERLIRRFAPRQEISGPGGGPIQLEDSEATRRLAWLLQNQATIEGTAVQLIDSSSDATLK